MTQRIEPIAPQSAIAPIDRKLVADQTLVTGPIVPGPVIRPSAPKSAIARAWQIAFAKKDATPTAPFATQRVPAIGRMSPTASGLRLVIARTYVIRRAPAGPLPIGSPRGATNVR